MQRGYLDSYRGPYQPRPRLAQHLDGAVKTPALSRVREFHLRWASGSLSRFRLGSEESRGESRESRGQATTFDGSLASQTNPSGRVQTRISKKLRSGEVGGSRGQATTLLRDYAHRPTETLDTHAILRVGGTQRPASPSTNDKKMRNKANSAQSNCNQRLTAVPSCPAPPGSRSSAGLVERPAAVSFLAQQRQPFDDATEGQSSPFTAQRKQIDQTNPISDNSLRSRSLHAVLAANSPPSAGLAETYGFCRAALLSIARSSAGAAHGLSSRLAVHGPSDGSHPNGNPMTKQSQFLITHLDSLSYKDPPRPTKTRPASPRVSWCYRNKQRLSFSVRPGKYVEHGEQA